MVFKTGNPAEGACRRFIAPLLVTVQPGTKTAAHAAPACPTAPLLWTDKLLQVCLLFPSGDTGASVLFSISSLAVCFAVDICTLQTVAVANWGLQHVMHATGLACRHDTASGQGALVAAGLHRHASSPAKAMLE